MAQITICDVKACGDIIKSSADLRNTNIAGTNYQLCKKCADGLAKFIDENLIKPNAGESPISKLAPQDYGSVAQQLEEYIKQMGTIGQPAQPWFSGPSYYKIGGFSSPPKLPSFGGVYSNPNIYTVSTTKINIGDAIEYELTGMTDDETK